MHFATSNISEGVDDPLFLQMVGTYSFLKPTFSIEKRHLVFM